MRQIPGSRFSLSIRSLVWPPEVTTESGMPLVVKSVSQGDELERASWFNITMADPLSAAITHRQSSVGYGTLLPYSLREILIARLFDTLSIANQGSFYNTT